MMRGKMAKSSQWKAKHRLQSLPEYQTVGFANASSWLEEGLVSLRRNQLERTPPPVTSAHRSKALTWLNKGLDDKMLQCHSEQNGNSIVRTHFVSLPEAFFNPSPLLPR